MASIRSGLSCSSVLVDGSDCTLAITGAGVRVTIGAGVELVGVAVATVGVATAADGATVAVEGAGAVVDAVVGGRRVPAHGAFGRFAMNSHGGSAEDGAVGPVHVDDRNRSLINETKPMLARALPYTVTPASIVMDASARIVPAKVEPDPKVAELTTRQKTLHGLAPFTKLTRLDDAVTRSDVALKIQTELGSF
jgi:hypothetical protein